MYLTTHLIPPVSELPSLSPSSCPHKVKQAADENCDMASGRQVWRCESSKSVTTVTEYERYQQKMLQKEAEVTMVTGHPYITSY